MEARFWHQKWEQGEIGFHQSEVNPWLQAHLSSLNLPSGARVFLPLCGKTLDIAWLLAQGNRVVGVELSELAIQALFEHLALRPQIVRRDNLIHYSAQNIEIFVGDIFALTTEHLGAVDAVYDRAALVAMPPATRPLYAAQTSAISQGAPQLLVTYEYDQSLRAGPPFSVGATEIAQIFGSAYDLLPLAHSPVTNSQFKSAAEVVWHLQAKGGGFTLDGKEGHLSI
ncbi:MAG: thiopurine S-methyltransferase [Candidatus Sericytochromatia bacterium]|nr:thiopurine S-methyltransferase [Candidatus Sericytochromatia bacterium]